ncbi:MAG: serine/threonine protein kinase [Fibrobacteres bacterium]|jgi:serine/threonine protein kinase|nr:serine/threonine protein kinase [Fibrobacterota bacterium]
MSIPPSLPDLTGLTLGTVTLLQKIGEGSMGVVYRGFQNTLSRPVAVKVVFRNRLNKLFTSERFRQEAEVVANLLHPNIVTIFEFGEQPDYMYFVMQLVDGVNLSAWLKQKKKHPLPKKRLPSMDDLLRVAEQALEVLVFAHGEGVIHRDIKPENLMWVEKTRKVMVADFGLAAVYHTVYDEEKAFILGSPLYVSPEQARGDAVDGRADLFSLGCVLLELSLGFLPVKVERPERIFQTRAKESPDMFTGMARDLSAAVPRAWSDFMSKSLVPKREQRFRDAEEMLAAMRAIAPGLRAADKESSVPGT